MASMLEYKSYVKLLVVNNFLGNKCAGGVLIAGDWHGRRSYELSLFGVRARER